MRIAVNAVSVRGGGGLTYLIGLLRHLPKPGDEIIAVASPHIAAILTAEVPGLRVHALTVGRLLARLLWEHVALAEWVRRQGAEVLLSPGNTGPLFRSCRFVVVVQNVDPLVSLSLDMPVLYAARQAMLRALTVASVRRAQAVIAVSQYTRRLIEAACGPRPIAVIPHGRPEDAERPPPPDVADRRARMGLYRPYLLAVSSIKINKNYPRLLEAFAASRTPGHELVIAGHPEHAPAMRAVIACLRDRRLQNRVRLVGTQDRASLRALYDGATALVFPSTVESFGLPVLEAIAYGVPVATARLAPVEEICGPAALYFEPDDVGAMTHAIDQMVADGSLRQRLAAEGRARAEAYTWESAARATRAVLEAVG